MDMKSASVANSGLDLRVRRQIYELTPHDLETFPIWEFNLDETAGTAQDELTVRPRVADGPNSLSSNDLKMGKITSQPHPVLPRRSSSS